MYKTFLSKLTVLTGSFRLFLKTTLLSLPILTLVRLLAFIFPPLSQLLEGLRQEL